MQDEQLKILVEETIKHNEGQDRQLKVMKALVALLVVLVVVLGVFSFTLSREVTQMCNAVTNTMSPENMQTLLTAIDGLEQQVAALDMNQLNEKLGNLDVDALNSALSNLSSAADKMGAVADRFTNNSLLSSLLGG